jgi:hypothetical protein
MIEVRFDGDRLILEIDGEMKSVELKSVSHKLLAASELERNLFQISPSGYGIHWPLIDEDLSIKKLSKP